MNFLEQDHWLSETIKRPAYRLRTEAIEKLDDELRSIETVPSGVVPGKLTSPKAFVYCKLAVADTLKTTTLTALGFQLVDTNITFDKTISSGSDTLDSSKTTGQVYQVRFAKTIDEQGVVEVARNSFEFSRFHLDPHFEKSEANHIKAEWARNYFKGNRGNAMIVACAESQVVGFLQLIFRQSELIIDLIAVHPEHQRRGLAKAMIDFASTSCGNFTTLVVGTQVANTPSVRFYETYGFGFKAAQYVFHLHKSFK